MSILYNNCPLPPRTVVEDGLPTVYSTMVSGSQLEGEYIQLVTTGSSVLEKSTGQQGFPGSAELTRLPSLELQEKEPERSKADIARESQEKDRNSAQLSFKERLRERFRKFRDSHGPVLARQSSLRERGYGRAIGEPVRRQEEEGVSFGKKSDIIRNKLRQVLQNSNKVKRV